MIDVLAAATYDHAPSLATMLLHALWQDALLAVAAGVTLRAMARASAASRHNVAMAFLVAMLFVPALTAPWLDTEGYVFTQGSSPAAIVAVLLWLAGATWMIARYVAGLHTIAAMERSAHLPLPETWQRRAEELRNALGIAAAVSIRLSNDVLIPCSARLLRPVVWLPLSLLTRTPAEQLEALLAHELAHIARKDWLWNGVQYAVESLLFFHPAVWWLGRRIRDEREHACDDRAIAACGNPIALAEVLATLERDRQSYHAPVLAACGGRLQQRIARLVSDSPVRGPWLRPALACALVVSAALSIPQAGLAGNRLPALNMVSSTSGSPGPGDYVEITANEPGKVRFYRLSIDAQGHITEIYQESGRIHPIDTMVRQWLDEVERRPLGNRE